MFLTAEGGAVSDESIPAGRAQLCPLRVADDDNVFSLNVTAEDATTGNVLQRSGGVIRQKDGVSRCNSFQETTLDREEQLCPLPPLSLCRF